MEQEITKEVFDAFFKENYCEVEYKLVKDEFEAIATLPTDIFTEDKPLKDITKKNFILYLRNEAYCEFEAIVEENFEALNPEIVDAVMDVAVSMDNEDEITGIYWQTLEDLLKQFLNQLFEDVIAKWIAQKLVTRKSAIIMGGYDGNELRFLCI